MYQMIVPYYKEIFPLKSATLSFIKSHLKGVHRRILDAGCAVGQLVAALAQEGHEVTGIDLDAAAIEAAKKDAVSQGIEADFKIMNMMEVDINFHSHYFDMVLCLGNTLVHLQSPEEIGEFIRKVSGLLKESGVFIIQLVNYDHVLAQGITELPVIETEYIRFERHYIYDKKIHRMHFRTYFTIKKDMTHFEDEVLLYPLIQKELDSLIKKAGFGKVDYFGDFLANKYSIESPALIARGAGTLFVEP